MRKIAMILCAVMLLSVFGGVPMRPLTVQAAAADANGSGAGGSGAENPGQENPETGENETGEPETEDTTAEEAATEEPTTEESKEEDREPVKLQLEKERIEMQLGGDPYVLKAYLYYEKENQGKESGAGQTDSGEYDIVPVTKNLKYTVTSGDDVIDMNGAEITAVKEGAVTVRVSYAVNEEKTLTAECGVTVINPVISLDIRPSSLELVVGKTQDLQAMYTYYDGTVKPAEQVSYVSSDPETVRVDAATGRIEALKVGKDIEITAGSPDGKYYGKCKVTVIGIKVESIVLNASELNTLKIGDTFQLVSMLTPGNATDQKVTYAVVETTPLDASISSSVVSVGKSTGLVTIKGLGKAVVEATTSDGSLKARCTFSVYQNYFDVTKLGADGKDEKKDTSYINKALKWAAAIDEKVTVYVPAGTYYIGSRLYIYSDTKLVLDSKAKIVRVAADKETPMLQSMYSGGATGSTKGYKQCENIEITGGVWDGNPSGKDYPNNFYIGHAQNVSIHDTTIKNNSGSHLIELAGVKNATIENVNLEGFRISNNKGCPVSGQSLKEAIQLDYCSKASASAFTPHDNTACQNITIRNCNISNYMCGIGAHGCSSGVYLKNILIENNTFSNITNCCVDLRNFRDVTVRDNTAKGYHTFLYGYNSTGVIQNNKLENKSFTPITKNYRMYANGIYLSTKSEFTIEGNTISGCGNHGISIASQSKVTIKNNKVKKNSKYGIKVENATATIKGNTVSGNKYSRQYFSDSKAKITADNIQAYAIPLDAEYVYTGKAIKPDIVISGLKKGKTFTVSYKKNKKVGTATVTIKGKGKVKGKLVLNFKIIQKSKKAKK